MEKEYKIVGGFSSSEYDTEIKCPFCDGNYVNFESGKMLKLKDGTLAIPMKCEESHYWKLCFAFHKGNTRMYVAKVEPEVVNDVFGDDALISQE